MVSILEAEGLTLTRAVADAISLHPCQCDGHSADTCPSAIAALAAVRKWDAEHAPQPIGYGVALQCDFSRSSSPAPSATTPKVPASTRRDSESALQSSRSSPWTATVTDPPSVVGLDPSVSATGIARADGTTLHVGGDAKLGDQRLVTIHDAVREACIDAELVVIEDLPRGARGGSVTGMAQGVIRCWLLRHGITYVLVSPATLKQYATGKGTSDKADMRMALYKRTGIDLPDDNEVDAWWLAAIGRDLIGSPLVTMPASHRAALAKIRMPDVTT